MNRVVFDEPIYLGDEEEDPLDAYLLAEPVSSVPSVPAPAPEPFDLDALMLADSPDVQARRQVASATGDDIESLLAERPSAPARPAPRREAPPQRLAQERAPRGPDRELQAAENKGRERAMIAGIGRAFNRAFGSQSQDGLLAEMQANSDQPVESLMRRREQERTDRRTARGEAREDEQSALAAQRRDPASPVNQRFQEAMRATFRGSVSDDVISQMTVEDQEALGLMGAARAAQERTQAMQAARQNELTDAASAQQGRVDLENLDHSNRIALEREQNVQRENRARIMAGRNAGARAATVQTRDDLIDMIVEERGMPRARVELLVPSNPRDFSRFRDQYARDALIRDENSEAAAAAREGTRGEAADRSHAVPGWTRSADAPTLSQGERSNARQIASTAREVDAQAARMLQLARQIRAAEAAGGAAGVDSQLMAEARTTQAMLSASLRQLFNFGVPNGPELAIVNGLASQIDTPSGFINAANRYQALRTANNRRTNETMAGLGYAQGGSGGGGGGRGAPAAPARVRIRLPDGRQGTVAPENLEAALADGAERM